ncbi:capsule biosynthesis protein [Alkanindiges sp. WGS2144]|uniref:capsule biosynthesis protein n=1 Tax=Alkanindiges sp. WGS2144 TaxID=3366808 RepID=UPI0037504152
MGLPVDELSSAHRVLLLQGPMGNFFSQLAAWLESHGTECYKVNFNAGDWFFYHGRNVFNYHGRLDHFKHWLKKHLLDLNIEAVVCFGDCRFYHIEARQLTQELGLHFFVFEEGYIRPDYITLERGGVNDYSGIKQKFLSLSDELPPPDKPLPVYPNYKLLVQSAFVYYLMWSLFFWLFPFYKHHRLISPLAEIFYWLRSLVRRAVNYQIEPHRFLDIIKKHDKRYFVVALQVHNDSQVRVHSDYDDVKEFIVEVLTSFASHAPQDKHLVIKHHPMDRGYRHYGALVKEHALRLEIAERVHYVCDVHLPTLLKHSIALVTINSTTGLQALFHDRPVKTMGRAIYDLPRLTYQGSLDQFWKNPGRVNRLAYRRFRYTLVHYSQLNGSYYGLSPWMVKPAAAFLSMELDQNAQKAKS